MCLCHHHKSIPCVECFKWTSSSIHHRVIHFPFEGMNFKSFTFIPWITDKNSAITKVIFYLNHQWQYLTVWKGLVLLIAWTHWQLSLRFLCLHKRIWNLKISKINLQWSFDLNEKACFMERYVSLPFIAVYSLPKVAIL